MTTSIWIVHRDSRLRGALSRLSGAGEAALTGAPGDVGFTQASPPRTVLLGLTDDYEAELEFAHRFGRRHADARWIVLAGAGELEEAARLFDGLPAEWLAFPPTASELRGRIRRHQQSRAAEGLGERRERERIAERFRRYFADLELPSLLRAMDPHLAGVPLLVRGEPGSGRGLLARYVHAFGQSPATPLVVQPCEGIARSFRLRELLAAGLAERPGRQAAVCLEDVDALPATVQRELRHWVELGVPGGLATREIRWMATAGPEIAGLDRLDPDLALALAGVSVEIPALRDRPEAIEAFANETAAFWSRSRRERPRSFGPDALAQLRDYPWPGNLRELEGVVVRTLAADGGDPLGANQLRFPGGTVPGEPLAATPAARVSEPDAPAAEATAESIADEAAALERTAHGPENAAEALAPADSTAPPAGDGGEGLRGLVRALDHEVRNPLVAIRTFASLLPERADDPEFRDEFSTVVGDDLGRIQAVLDRLDRYAALEPADSGPADVAAILEERLDSLRGQIQERRLLVLKELDRSHPYAAASPAAVSLAFEMLLERALSWMPERADLYIASKYHPTGLHGSPSVRVLIRFYQPGTKPAQPADDERVLSSHESALEVVLARLIVRGQGGNLTLDATDSEETVILVDLPG